MKTTANYATHPAPGRLEALRISVESIINQVDIVRIYWNEYNVHDVPDWFRHNDKIECAFGPNRTDNAKLLFLGPKNEYYFMADDKIIYPSDYVEVMLRHLETNQVVSCHGRKIVTDGNYLNSYYLGSHLVYDYRMEVKEMKPVEIIGTGVTAFDTAWFRPDTIANDKRHKMSDLLFSLEAAKQNIPLFVIPHAEGWLRCQQMPSSICAEMQKTDQKEQIEIVKEIINILGL